MVSPKNADLLQILQQVDPSMLEYQEWVNVGMALKEAGFTASDWDNWSRQDPGRYHAGECFKKWDTFRGASTPVKSGTIVQLAMEQGWCPPDRENYALDWDAVIGGKDDLVIIDRGWVEGREVSEPPADKWNPVADLIKYLEILFEAGENVGYVTESWYNEEKKRYLPTKGHWDRTAGQLIQALNQCSGDIGSVLGDYKPEVGAWIRFNPLNGKGCQNENVSEYRFALVESDKMEIDKQNAILRELELPIACLVHSGKKSLHAIVRIDAASYEEYRKRVEFLYDVCKKNGLVVDIQNKNPSRLSRMPGVMREGRKQWLVDNNIGKASWQEWQDWVEAVNDDLPEPESMADAWDNLPPLADSLIEGVLRKGHKMLIAGPSKAGKSYALIQMCIDIAEGKKWLGWQCAKGRVLYVNLELDRASCLHRFRDVYEAMGFTPHNLKNIDIWNLRGKSVPMDKLAPKLIRRATKKGYMAIIIDPIYKVITGDENSADQMAKFCNQFDLVCTELGSAVIYCHHHSKGTQGQKRSMDRASGSGVFARDPDAMMDLIELEVTDAMRAQEENKAVCAICDQALTNKVKNWEESVSQDAQCSQHEMLQAASKMLTREDYNTLAGQVDAVKANIKQRTAWRIEGTLREFPKFAPVNMWFDYPIHRIDDGCLKDAGAEGENPPWQKATDKRKANAKKSKKDKKLELEEAVQACKFGEPPTKKELADYLEVTERSVSDRLKAHGGFMIDKNNGNVIVRNNDSE